MSNKKKNSIIMSIIFFAAIGIFPKQETLKCDRVKNTCLVERANFYNIKSQEALPSPESISTFAYQKKYNSSTKRRDYYNIMMELKSGGKSHLFSKRISKKTEAENIINSLNSLLSSNKPKIKYVLKSGYFETIFY